MIFKSHGNGGSGDIVKKDDFGILIKEREDFILVVPDGYDKSWNVAPRPNYQEGGTYGNYTGPICKTPRKRSSKCHETCELGEECKSKKKCFLSKPCVDDIGFIEKVQNSLKDDLCIDTNQMHYAGYSYGGVMGWNIASQAEDGLGFASFYTLASVPFLGDGKVSF